MSFNCNSVAETTSFLTTFLLDLLSRQKTFTFLLQTALTTTTLFVQRFSSSFIAIHNVKEK